VARPIPELCTFMTKD